MHRMRHGKAPQPSSLFVGFIKANPQRSV